MWGARIYIYIYLRPNFKVLYVPLIQSITIAIICWWRAIFLALELSLATRRDGIEDVFTQSRFLAEQSRILSKQQINQPLDGHGGS